MKIHVVITFFQGGVDTVKAFTAPDAAEAARAEFLEKYYAGSVEKYKEYLENAVEVDHEIDVYEVEVDEAMEFDDLVEDEDGKWVYLCDEHAPVFKGKLSDDDYPPEGTMCSVKGCPEPASRYGEVK